MSPLPEILVVDDDETLHQNLAFALENSFNFSFAKSVSEALTLLQSKNIEVIVLDYVLNDRHDGINGYDKFRENKFNQPVVVVSGYADLQMAKGFLKRKIAGFLEKPFSAVELKTSLNEILSAPHRPKDSLGYFIDENRRTIIWKDQEITLTRIEFEILRLFVENRGVHLSREKVVSAIWKETQVSRHTLDTHLINLRRKLPPFAEHLIAIHGTGFRYDP